MFIGRWWHGRMRSDEQPSRVVERWRQSWAGTVVAGVLIAGVMTAADLPLRSMVASDAAGTDRTETTSSCAGGACR